MKRIQFTSVTMSSMNASKPKAHSNGPIMSGQIMIQSEQELLLMKQVNIIAICLNQNFIVQLQNDEKNIQFRSFAKRFSC